MSWYEFDSFRFEVETRILSKSGREVALTPKAADLLMLFLQNPEKIFPGEELKQQVWKDTVYVEDDSLRFQVHAVRNALGKRPNGEGYIRTLPKRGYQFVAPVQGSFPNRVTIPPDPDTEQQLLPAEARNGAADAQVANPPRPAWLSGTRWAANSILAGIFLVLLVLTAALASRDAPAPRIWIDHHAQLTNDAREKQDGTLLTDGVRVFFVEDGPEGATLAQVPAAGGGTGSVPLPGGFRLIFDLSPSTSEFLAGPPASDRKDQELWVVPIVAGSPRRIGNLSGDPAAWSPDRQLIAFGLRQRLCIAKADGSEQRIIAEVGGAVFSPHWSPDGRKLTFSERRPDQDEYQSSIWQVGADGSNLHRLLDGWNKPRKECCGVWTPDGEFLIFQSVHGDRTDLYALPDRQGFFAGEFRSPVRLTSGTQSFSTPAVSPDGKHLFAIGKEPRGELVRYDSKSGEFIRFLRGIDATWVSFSRSGRKVAYISDPDLTVWRANIDGDMKSQVTFSPQEADGLSWSPDGKWFAMRCRSAGKPWNICLVPSIGGDPTPLIPSETEQAIPTWSADSKRIAFGDVPPGNSKGSGKEAIHILRLSDRTITDLPGSRGLYTARWSPDGHLFCALTIVGHRLKLYDFQTKKWRETEAEAVDNPTWSHDGKYIYYDREAPHRALCRVRVADGHVDPLVDLRDTPVEAGWWSGVTLDNSPLILENIGTTEIYSLTLDSSR